MVPRNVDTRALALSEFGIWLSSYGSVGRYSQVLSGETRFLRIRAYPEKIGAEAPEQPQNSRQSQKRGIFLSALALAAGAKRKCYPEKRVFSG